MITIRRVPNLASHAGRSCDILPYRGGDPALYLRAEELTEEFAVVLNRALPVLGGNEVAKMEIQEGTEVLVAPRVEDATKAGILIGSFILGGVIGVLLASTAYTLTAPKPSFSRSESGVLDDSPSYNINGLRNTNNAEAPIAPVFGQARPAGNIINEYIEYIDNEAIYRVLVNLGEGVFEDVAGITATRYSQTISDTTNSGYVIGNGKFSNAEGLSDFSHPILEYMCDEIGAKLLLDGNPISDYVVPGPKGHAPILGIRFGDDDQTPIPFHDELHDHQVFNDQLFYKTQQDYTLKNDDTEAIVLLFEAPSLFEAKKSGSLDDQSTSVEVYYREEDDTSGAYADGFHLAGTFTLNGETNSAKRGQFRIDGLTPGRYLIRLYKTVGDSTLTRQRDLYLKGIDEIRKESYAYPRCALLSLSIKASERLQNAPVISTLCKGQKNVEVWNGASFDTQWTRNPIWCLRYFLLDKTAGLGSYVPRAIIDAYQDEWIAAAAHCDEEVTAFVPAGSEAEARCELDWVMDGRMSATDAIHLMCAAAECTWNGIYPVPNAAAAVRTQIFGMGNIEKGSFGIQTTRLSETPTLLHVRYHDRDNDFKEDYLEVAIQSDLAAGGRQLADAVWWPGVSRRSQAARMGAVRVREGKYNVRNAAWNTALDGVGCVPGDVVDVSHRLPAWGESGRVTAATASTVTLDRAVTVDDTDPTLIRVRHAGTDTIEERTINEAAGEYAAGAELDITPNWTATPAADDVAEVGVLPGKPFRITGLVEDGVRMNITGHEYNEEIFDLSSVVVSVPDYSTHPDPRRTPPAVEDLKLTNVGGYSMELLASWAMPQTTPGQRADAGIVSHWEVWMALDGDEDFRFVGNTAAPKATWRITGAVPRRTYKVRVVTVSKWGVKTGLEASPEASVVAVAGPPPNVTGLRLKGRPGETEFFEPSPEFEWNAVSVANNAVSGLGGGATPAGGIPDQFFDHFVVQVWSFDTDGVTPVKRGEFSVRDPYFRLSIELNRELHGGTAKRHVNIAVYARDVYGGASPDLSFISVINNKPAKPTNVRATVYTKGGDGQFSIIEWDESSLTDLSHHKVVCEFTDEVDDDEDFYDHTITPVDARGSSVTLPVDAGDVPCGVAAVDTFGYTTTEGSPGVYGGAGTYHDDLNYVAVSNLTFVALD